MHMPPKVGFAGTGTMGFHMARRLAESGYQVRVWNRTAAKAERLIPHGIQVAASAAEVARDADFVICMLGSDQACDEVLFSPGQVVKSMKIGSTLIVMSSISVETARRQSKMARAYGVDYLDAPVSGDEEMAENATLVITAGGDAEVFERSRVLLAAMGRPTRVGPVGAGQLARLVYQMLAASSLAAVAEALLFAERGGVDLAKLQEALLGEFADVVALRQHGQRMIKRDFSHGRSTRFQTQDIGTAIVLARDMGLALPMLDLVNGLYADMVERGDGDLDPSAIILELQRRQEAYGDT